MDNVNLSIHESSKEWVATARHARTDDLFGFIRHSKDKDSLELTNFKASLPRKALGMGVTSKRNNGALAGTHGEGIKVAALVMVRKRYQVRYESAKYYWSFSFGGRDKRHLYCQLTPMKDSEIRKSMTANYSKTSSGNPRALTSNIWEDFTVKIGKVYGSTGRMIDFDTFLRWITVSFHL